MSLPTIIRLRNYRHYTLRGARVGSGPLAELEVRSTDWKAPKGKVFVALLLGTENADGSDPLPVLDFLRSLEIDGQPVVPESIPPQKELPA